MSTTVLDVPLSDATRERLREISTRARRSEAEIAATLIEGALAADQLDEKIPDTFFLTAVRTPTTIRRSSTLSRTEKVRHTPFHSPFLRPVREKKVPPFLSPAKRESILNSPGIMIGYFAGA